MRSARELNVRSPLAERMGRRHPGGPAKLHRSLVRCILEGFSDRSLVNWVLGALLACKLSFWKWGALDRPPILLVPTSPNPPPASHDGWFGFRSDA